MPSSSSSNLSLIANIKYPDALPISEKVEEIKAILKQSQVVIIAGETGSGKTTQIPKIALQAGLGKRGIIGCTQPRRVAALTVSKRIAEEMGTEWGNGVGAKIRFTDKTSSKTLIKIMTDGILLNEIESDPELNRYGAIILDEAHERSLNIDFLLGHLKRLIQRRKDLSIIITSATIDTKAFSKAFDDAPIIEVSGRTFPVEVIYAPLDELLEESGEFTYIEGVVEAVQRILDWNRPGDLLIFLPGERDIRDARSILEGRLGNRVEVLPLFGRLSNQDQEKIFKPVQRRKIILSTNIAETSVTIPGIRYVVDVGLVRMSRYNAQTHTQRLPIEKVSRSSANQRMGRAGRMSEGVCVRLYSEADFVARDLYSTPEILRSNLASVILRLKAFHLGDVESFPFIDPPTPRAIQAGYRQLTQIGAIDSDNELTAIGRRLAKLPVDPAIGRMLLEGIKEGCLTEILIIASGLSIQDPREVPMEAVEAARTQHKIFQHDESDFMTYLNIWNSFHDELEKLTQNQLRKFCKSHFLSYLRMREWRDIHSQLSRLLEDSGEVRFNRSQAEYFQIHRALLVGLLSGVATREEGNTYRAPHNRMVELFPGSTLFNKKLIKRHKKKNAAPIPVDANATKTPPWILAAEWVETNRLYARTVAKIDPNWIIELGDHLIETRYSEPAYDEKEARVFVRERKFLFGLLVGAKRVNYVKINPHEATEIFIQAALVDGQLESKFEFVEKNQKIRGRVENLQTRMGTQSQWALEETIRKFYSERIESVGSEQDLRRWIRRHFDGDANQLLLSETDLLAELSDPSALNSFPESFKINEINSLDIHYAYKPGGVEDGATLKVPISQFSDLQPDHLIWAVPGFLKEVIEHLFRALPKALRQQLFPIGEKAEFVHKHLKEKEGGLDRQLSRIIALHFGIEIPLTEWKWEQVPEYLRPRVQVVNDNMEIIASGRELTLVKENVEAISKGKGEGDNEKELLTIWRNARKQYEREIDGIEDFPAFGKDLKIGSLSGIPVLAYPGLKREGTVVWFRLFYEEEEAIKQTRPAFQTLALRLGSKELTWLERDLKKVIGDVALTASDLFSKDVLIQSSWVILQRYWFELSPTQSFDKRALSELIEQSQKRAKGSVYKWVDVLNKIFQKRLELLSIFPVGSAGRLEVDALVGKSFFKQIDFDRAQAIPLFLEAIQVRIKKAKLDPTKDKEKANQILPYLKTFQQLKQQGLPVNKLRWMIEDFKVQIFAQELGTYGKISVKILDAEIERLRNSARS